MLEWCWSYQQKPPAVEEIAEQSQKEHIWATQKKNSSFQLYWIVNRDPSNGLL